MAGIALPRFLAQTPPPLILAASYASVIATGAVLLMLPFAHSRAITWSDAIFTATSAVTVTGLGVIDVGSELTFFGQAVILLLIQVGGLGLMAFAVMVLGALGLPVGLTGHVFLREDLNQNSIYQIMKLLRTILRFVVLFEVVGAMLLALTFIPREGFWPGLWVSVFHSVSAFNNAGFSTFSESLSGYATDPVVNIVVPGLLICGGIGYAVLLEVTTIPQPHRWSLNTKIMLLGTAILIPVSVGLFALLEWNNAATLGHFHSIPDKLMASWFQGVTTRTAGFNTVDIGALHDDTSLLFMALMMIGGGPASTAGGIKVTTFMVMMLATVAFFRRQTQLNAFGRSIGLDQVLKVSALMAISVMVILTAIFLLVATHDGNFLDACFEVVSAFGTVGLSRGFTGQLSEFGRAVIIAVMFLGRVGPLTLGFLLATRTTARVRYPAGVIHLG